MTFSIFPDHFQITWLFQVFQVGGHPVFDSTINTVQSYYYYCYYYTEAGVYLSAGNGRPGLLIVHGIIGPIGGAA